MPMPFGVGRPIPFALGVRSPSSSGMAADEDEKNKGDDVTALVPFGGGSLDGLPFDLAGLPLCCDCESDKS